MINTSLFDYNLPKKEEEFLKFLPIWINLHSNDHRNFAKILSDLGKAFDLAPIATDMLHFVFDFRSLPKWNEFLMHNKEHHKRMHTYYNDIGMQITNPTIIKPNFNVIQQFEKFDLKVLSMFIFKEQRIHLLFARALNLLLENM